MPSPAKIVSRECYADKENSNQERKEMANQFKSNNPLISNNSITRNLELDALERDILTLSSEISESNNNIINSLRSYLSFKSSTPSPTTLNFALDMSYKINQLEFDTNMNEEHSNIEMNKTRFNKAM